MNRTPRFTPPPIPSSPHVYIFLLHIPQQHTCLISPRYFSDPCYIASTVLHTIGSGSGTQRSDEPLNGSVPYHGQPDESETAEHQASHNSHHTVVRYGTPDPPISGLRTTTSRYKPRPNRLPLIPYHNRGAPATPRSAHPPIRLRDLCSRRAGPRDSDA